MKHRRIVLRVPSVATLFLMSFCLPPQAYGLPSFARQTGQRCSACHVGGSWPQLTPWGRFFKLSGYTAGRNLVDKEGVNYVPMGLFGQAGLTWAAQPNDAQGGSVITQNGSPEPYQVTGEVGTKLTSFMGVFYEYQIGNTFPGWKGTSGPADVRAVRFFNVHGNELLVGIDSNNNPTVQDVWNSVPDWSYPFYSSPQAMSGPASPMITSLGAQSGKYRRLRASEQADLRRGFVLSRRYRLLPLDECGNFLPGRRRELPGGLQSLLASVLDQGARSRTP